MQRPSPGVRSKAPKYKAKKIGVLAVDLINQTLDTELDPGEAWLSREAHRHIAEDHADCYDICMAHMKTVVENPTFVGQQATNSGNIQLISRVPLGKGNHVLVAVGLTRNSFGNYNIRSAYVIDEKDVAAKRQSGAAKQVIKK